MEPDRGWCVVKSLLVMHKTMLSRRDSFDHMDCVAENLTYEEAVALRNLMNAGAGDGR